MSASACPSFRSDKANFPSQARSVSSLGMLLGAQRVLPAVEASQPGALPQKTREPAATATTHLNPLQQALRRGGLALGGAALAAALTLVPLQPAAASDVAAVGTCLLAKCQGALTRCLNDTTCISNLVCLNRCNGEPDETACQIRCGDLYAGNATHS